MDRTSVWTRLSNRLSLATLLPTITGFMYPGEEVLPSAYTKFFKNRLMLGLDLQGGIHLEYKVDTREALINKSRNFALRLRDDLRANDELPALKGAQITVKSRKDGDVDEVTQLTAIFKTDEHYTVFSDEVAGFLNRFYPEYEWLAPRITRQGSVTIGCDAPRFKSSK